MIASKISHYIKSYSRFLKFLFGGMAIFMCVALLTVILTEVVGIWYMYSYAIAQVIGVISVFTYHFLFTFKMNSRVKHTLAKFLLLVVTLETTTWLSVFFLSSIGIHYLLSIIIVATIFSIVSYKINKNWVFLDASS